MMELKGMITLKLTTTSYHAAPSGQTNMMQTNKQISLMNVTLSSKGRVLIKGAEEGATTLYDKPICTKP